MPFLKKHKLNLCKAPEHLYQLNGYRPYFVFPDFGGIYKGEWIKNIPNGFGSLHQRNNLVYDGQWKDNLRDGQGSIRKINEKTGYVFRIYIGEWKNGMKHGEGKKIYKNGLYHGWWKKDQRCGLGIMWYNNKAIYLGEWENDVYHGIGVLYYVNGDRYEGNFLNGKKDGAGLYYHNRTGQLQNGMWVKGICKTSFMMDCFREQVTTPTHYPLQRSGLDEPDSLVRDLFREFIAPPIDYKDSFEGLYCFEIVRKMKKKYDELYAESKKSA